MKTLEKQPYADQKPVLTGNEGSPIPLDQASQWTLNYRERYPNEVLSYFFGVKIVEQILRQEGCIGLRIYYANSQPLNAWQRFILSISNFLRKVIADAEGEKHLLIVGADQYGTDQLPGEKAGLSNENHPLINEEEMSERSMPVYATSSVTVDNIVAEQATPCPGSPGCPKNSLTEASR